jgi:hypothetical protein
VTVRSSALERIRALERREVVGQQARPWAALGLVLVLAALVPLAHASPPDPTWIGGIYDGADLDEAVVAVMSASAAGADGVPSLAKPADALAGVTLLVDAVRVPSAPPSAFPIRAPPA